MLCTAPPAVVPGGGTYPAPAAGVRDPTRVAAYVAEPAPDPEPTVDLAAAEPLTVTCPRCGTEASQRFYGPCASCVSELHAKFDAVARDVEAAEYVPQMNVTPNAVATKD